MAVLAIMVSTTEIGIKGGRQDCTISKDGVCIKEFVHQDQPRTCSILGNMAGSRVVFAGTCPMEAPVLETRNMSA